VSCAYVVAVLAKLRYFTHKEIIVVASMHLVARSAILCHGRVLKGERSSLFRVATIAKVRCGIGF